MHNRQAQLNSHDKLFVAQSSIQHNNLEGSKPSEFCYFIFGYIGAIINMSCTVGRNRISGFSRLKWWYVEISKEQELKDLLQYIVKGYPLALKSILVLL